LDSKKYEKIISVAGSLISKKGYNGTSFQGIADKVGIHKTTIFHYFRNKEDLLLKVLERSVEEVNSNLRQIVSDEGLGPEEKLKRALNNHLRLMLGKYADNVNAYLYELRNLSPKNRRKYLEKRKMYEKDFRKIVDEMKGRGYFDGLDSKIVTFGILGMLNWVIKWYKKSGPLGAEDISDIFYRMLVK